MHKHPPESAVEMMIQIVHECVVFLDHPNVSQLQESWSTIFEQSIADQVSSIKLHITASCRRTNIFDHVEVPQRNEVLRRVPLYAEQAPAGSQR
jgi:hypothetical protein